MATPSCRETLNFPDEICLRIRVGADLAGMLGSKPAFQSVVGAGRHRMRAEIVTEIKMTLNLGRVTTERVDLMRPEPFRRVPPEVSPTRDAEFTKALIAKRFEAGWSDVQRLHAIDDCQHVDHWLRDDIRNGRTTDVMNGHEARFECVLNPNSFLVERDRPSRVMRGEDDRTVGPISGHL
jgi:hypothetical protein